MRFVTGCRGRVRNEIATPARPPDTWRKENLSLRTAGLKVEPEEMIRLSWSNKVAISGALLLVQSATFAYAAGPAAFRAPSRLAKT